MNYKHLILTLLFLPLYLPSEDVLDESVYWELTRVDAKIEEKKFVTNDTLSIEDFNQIVGNELARLNSMLLLDGGDNVELSPGIGMGRLAVSEYPNLEAYLTNKHFVAKTFNLNALILATRLPTLAFMQSSWASLTPGATLSYQDHPSNYHQVKQQIKAKVRIFSAVIEHSGKDREVAGILIQLIENIQKEVFKKTNINLELELEVVGTK